MTITDRTKHQFFVLLLTSPSKLLMSLFCCPRGPDAGLLLSNARSPLLRDFTHPPLSLLVRHSKNMYWIPANHGSQTIMDNLRFLTFFFFFKNFVQSKISILHSGEPGKWERSAPGASTSSLSVEKFKIFK